MGALTEARDRLPWVTRAKRAADKKTAARNDGDTRRARRRPGKG